jgi:alpha-glucosidase (family GH31 glycosyl hydrolase)
MIGELHARGIKVILWQIPLQKTNPELTGQVRADADAMVRDGHAVLEADGSPYHNRGWWFPKALMADLSVQRTRDWWTAKRRYLVTDLDADGFKTDGGEHAWGHDLRYADGRIGAEGNNLYPVHYARAFGDLLRSAGKAPVTVTTDRPIMRAMFFDHGDDPEVWNWPLQYQLGDDLLVHPVTAPGATTWTTYLPAGRWVDVWTGDTVDGGRTVTRGVPIDMVPVYCRATTWSGLAEAFGG